MATILCALSGLEFKAQHMPIYLCANESYHPIFDLSHEKLLAMYESLYIEGKLSEEENYLYYLALFRSTELLDFRNAATRTNLTQSIIAHTINDLYLMVQRIHTLGIDKCRDILCLPRFIITIETKDLSCCKDWLKLWNANYQDYCTGYKTSTAIEKLSHLETLLERNIKTKLKDISSYAGMLADWASRAGSFPTYEVANERDLAESASSYWQRIIRACASKDNIFNINQFDLEDVIEHCEDNIEHGNIQAATLMALLRSAKDKKNSLATLGDIDLTATYKILKAEDGVEEANMLALILSAPKSAPVEREYPNKLAYIKAKMKYKQAQEYYAEHPTEHPDYVAPENNSCIEGI